MIFDDVLHDFLNSFAQIYPLISEQIRINIFEHFPKTSNPQPHNSTNHFSKILARRYARKRLNKFTQKHQNDVGNLQKDPQKWNIGKISPASEKHDEII